MTDSPLSTLRKQLLANGYFPLPNVGKACKVKGWNNKFLTHEIKRYGSLEQAVETWDSRFPRARTTGIQIRDGLCAIDGDVDDAELAATLADIVRAIAPSVFERAPARFGSGSYKVAWFCRLEGEPFVRHGSLKYSRADELTAWRAGTANKPAYHHVEVFGGKPTRNGYCSRQFGAFGPHTVGKVDYSWADGGTLADIRLADLPVITEARIWEILEAFEAAAQAAGGWEALPESAGGNGEGHAIYDIDRETTRFEVLGHGTCSYAELEALVADSEDVRCTSSFFGELSDTLDRCKAMWSDKYDCVMVQDWKTSSYHLPKDKKLDNTDLTSLADTMEELKAKVIEASVFDVALEPTDFYAYMVDHKYIHIATRALWPVASVNARLGKIGGMKAGLWLDKNRHVEQITWAPGWPELVKDYILVEGGWIRHRGLQVFNMYRAPYAELVAGDIGVWRRHLERIYPNEADEIEAWMAQRAQTPADKINHALVMGGRQGIGKDTILEPLRYAVGPWNFGEVNPVQMMGRFNGFLRSVVLRVNEVRDRGETDRYAFYNHTKAMLAAPPDTLPVDEKNMKEYRIPNIVGVIMTLNEKTSLYLSADDRRHFVAWSDCQMSDFDAEYFNGIYRWYADGGLARVAYHLKTLDLAGFDAKRPPRKTPAFHDIVRLSQAPEDADMAEALDALGRPEAVTRDDVIKAAGTLKNYDFVTYLNNSGNSRKVGYRFDEAGYTAVQNPGDKDGHWRIGERRQTIYVRTDLNHGERVKAARKRAERPANVLPLNPKSP
jgi:Family of unknown function (DUF5906)